LSRWSAGHSMPYLTPRQDCGMTESACFACSPISERPARDSPLNWSRARALCARHKSALVLEDGESVQGVLARAAPHDFPLEGSMLSWIYNPAFIGRVAGTRAWLDFAAGGMAALEDRFSAETYFEFVAFENPQATTLLYDVRLATAGGASVSSMSDAIRLATDPPKGSRSSQAHRQLSLTGFERLVQVWNFETRLARCRSRAGRLWPESFDELEAWIEEGNVSSGGQIEAGTDIPFFGALNGCAARRFVVLP
jgi:hypothetical protein